MPCVNRKTHTQEIY